MKDIPFGTTFKPGQTQQGFNDDGAVTLTLMSPAGKKMASHSAPNDAFELRNGSTPAVKRGK